MTLFIVSVFHGGPVAVFDSMEKAYAYVQRQPGRFNNFEIDEFELNDE